MAIPNASEKKIAIVTWASGPVLHAATQQQFFVNEAVLIGRLELPGEVIGINRDQITVQVYEDATGLRPGDTVVGMGMPLSVKLGPAILGGIYDGLLRPLTIEAGNFIHQGMQVSARAVFRFTPMASMGANLSGGDVFAAATDSDNIEHLCLVPPDVHGQIIHIADAGEYNDIETVCIVHASDGTDHAIAMSHYWPVRTPRPVRERLPISSPLLTGQRILDSLFPLASGRCAAMPGGFGTGKTVLQETLAKWCDADVIVYVGCGERGNEMAGVLQEFPALDDPRTGRPLMERTVIIANTSNMPVAAREASIYAAVTVGEYFRDQGLRVALMADSTSRWAEALREVSGRLGELPSESGYPAYLSSRLADFYERAANVITLGGKEGSLSIIGTVSPPSADFSEPVTTHTRRYVQVFWALDTIRAQARFYPAIHPLLSYSIDLTELNDFWKQQDHPKWLEYRRRFLTILEEQSRLERMARIIGKDALPPRQQHVLICADIINDAFLRQSAYSETDRYCSPQRQAKMMRLINRFIDLSAEAIENKVDINRITAMPIMRRLRRMNEDIGEDSIDHLDNLRRDIDSVFGKLISETQHETT